jgi:hypothetical protein
LAGCYGESLTRKFGDEPPPEWVSGISMLNDYQLQRGMRRVLLSGKPHAPALPEFMKLCRTVGHDDSIADEVKPQQHPALAAPPVDEKVEAWTALGNRYLMKYISTKIPENTQRWGRPATEGGMKLSTEPNADASPEFVRNVKTLVGFKNRWVDLMLEVATDDGVPIDDQQQCWTECMRMAEEEIARA